MLSFSDKLLLSVAFIVSMSSAFIDFNNSKPCVFTISGVSKFGIRTEQEFIRITRCLSGGQFQIVCVPVDNPENEKELNLKITESELEEMGLSGDSLQLAKIFLGEYIRVKIIKNIMKPSGISK